MKMQVETKGRLEFDPKETSPIFSKFVIKHGLAQKAYEEHLAETGEFKEAKITRIRYTQVGDGYQGVLEFTQTVADKNITKFSDDVKVVKKVSNHVKPNQGVFASLREHFEEEKKKAGDKKSVDLNYAETWDMFKDLYPKLQQKHFDIYLYDKRQWDNNVKLNKRKGVITIR
jgi:hypothetical protein